MPFISTKNGNRYLCKNDYKDLHYYEFPSAALEYHDIPTIEGVIDVAAFYNNFKDFIYNIVNNALNRVLGKELEGKLSGYNVMSHLKAKVYEPFYNHSTGTLCILLYCKA